MQEGHCNLEQEQAHCSLEQGEQHRPVLEVHCSLAQVHCNSVQGPELVGHYSLGQEHYNLVQELEHYSLCLERCNLVLLGNCSLVPVDCSLEQGHYTLVQVLMQAHCSLALTSYHVEEGHLQGGRRFACKTVQGLEQVEMVLVLVASH